MVQDVSARSIGVHFNQAGIAEAVVWAPEKKLVELITQDGRKSFALKKGHFGYWKLSDISIRPGDLYKIRIDGKDEFPDPASLFQPEGVHGPSQAVDLQQFSWDEHDWKNMPLQDYIIYELHTGTFTKDGTFKGIEQKLDHLVDLGITAIEIMPIAQFPGDRNWGYDGVFPFAVQNSYGGPEGLQQLINACHRKNLAVILDVVYNHIGPEGNYFKAFGPYFTEKYKTPWGEAINLDDAWCDGVRKYFIENALMWFRDFHIDALRLDAVHALKDYSATHFLQALRREVDNLQQHTGRTHYLIAECDLNDTKYINAVNTGGFGMDSQWIDEFHHALRVTGTGERNGYYSDFTGIEHLAKSYTNAYVFDGQFSPHRKKIFGVPAKDNAGQQFVVFSQNHDQVGNRMKGERLSELVSFEMQKLMAGAVLVAPYVPMLFMGEEWSEPNPFLYFISHADPQLVEAVRKGRKEEFAAFHHQGTPPDPFAEDTFLQSKLQWQLSGEQPHRSMLEYYKTFIALRKKLPGLAATDRKNIEVNCEADKAVLMVHRWAGAQHVYCYMNFSREKQSIPLPNEHNALLCILDSADVRWNGPGAAAYGEQEVKEQSLLMNPESIIILINHA